MLRVEDEWSFRNAIDEVKRETPPWQFAFGFSNTVAFSDYVQQLEAHSRGIGVNEGFVPNTFYVGIVAGVVVGESIT